MNRRQEIFGNKLKAIRTQKKLTQEQLGDSIGVSANAIGQFERGITYPNFETLSRIIIALGVDANLFFPSDELKDYPSSAKLFAELLKKTNSEDRVAVSNFLSNLSQIIVLSSEDEATNVAGHDGTKPNRI